MDELKKYIFEMKEQGINDLDIKNNLVSVGWKKEDFNKYFIQEDASSNDFFEEKGPYKLSKNFIKLQMIRNSVAFIFYSLVLLPFIVVYPMHWYISLIIYIIASIATMVVLSKLTYKYYKYSLRKNGFYKEYGIISRNYITIPYDKIQNIDVHQNLFERMLGLYHFKIRTAGNSGISEAEGYLPGLDKETSDLLVDELLEISSLQKSKLRQSETATEELKTETVTINKSNKPTKKFIEKGPYKLDSNYKIIYLINSMVIFGGLLIPLSTPIIVYLYNSQIDHAYYLPRFFLFLFQLYLIIALIMSNLYYKYYNYSLTKYGFCKEYGVLAKKHVTIIYDKIENIDIRQNTIERFLGLHRVMIQTAGNSGIEDSEGFLPGLDKEAAESLRDELLKLKGTLWKK